MNLAEIPTGPFALFIDRDGFRGGRWRRAPPFFFDNHCCFCDHFEELQTALIEVKLIINNGPFTYVYPNTIKTYLTPNHLLFYRRLLYYSNTTSTVVRTLTFLSSTTDKINRISNHFLTWVEARICSEFT